MEFSPHISMVVQTIQAAVAPVFLLTGIAAILNLLAGRLARVVDRARALERLHADATDGERRRHVDELRRLDRRMSVINAALLLCVVSAVAICLVVALLFVAELVHLPIGRIVAFAFIGAMLLLVAGLVLLMVEVHISLRSIHVRGELLEHDR